MSSKILFWILVSLGVIFEIIGDVFFKKWAINSKPTIMWIGFIIYIIGGLFWAYSLKYEMLSRAVSIFTILNLIIVSLVGIIFFKENVSVITKFGIILGIISIALIEQG